MAMDGALAIGWGHGGPGETLHLDGELTVATAHSAARELAARLDEAPAPPLADLTRITRLDSVGALVLQREAAGGRLRLPELDADRARLLDAVAAAGRDPAPPPVRLPFPLRELAMFGAFLIQLAATAGSFLAFLGATLVVGAKSLVQRGGLRLSGVTYQIEQAGVNALGIVGLISFLVGIVIAQQGAVQLRQFGADVFVINLVGRATLRELGVLLTAIMVAGRSASAFAAQIGSMKLAEEIDAMRVIGLDPLRILVLPRLVAMVLLLPLLAFFANICGLVGGGLFTWAVLDIPPAAYVQRLREVVPLTDLWIGLIKAPVFGALIAIVGCFQGMQVAGTAESVGQRTTTAVVQAIFLVIVLDAFFAVFFTAIGFE